LVQIQVRFPVGFVTKVITSTVRIKLPRGLSRIYFLFDEWLLRRDVTSGAALYLETFATPESKSYRTVEDLESA